ncbi:Amidohydro-rel domain-containing protein [Mycena indigotica]|uniref:Amidohydro-rel domain-containing protein n=1 Tax=Mycena indigotica TaxID=2126181 RepID=A0A8H6T3M1_9AGAR|nr:Amidohydro-rel domain-containing protein [Mycena indigotica]KAF7310260.1 Amidohydro-rel domain-containing protein [Mycena indigotica]
MKFSLGYATLYRRRGPQRSEPAPSFPAASSIDKAPSAETYMMSFPSGDVAPPMYVYDAEFDALPVYSPPHQDFAVAPTLRGPVPPVPHPASRTPDIAEMLDDANSQLGIASWRFRMQGRVRRRPALDVPSQSLSLVVCYLVKPQRYCNRVAQPNLGCYPLVREARQHPIASFTCFLSCRAHVRCERIRAVGATPPPVTCINAPFAGTTKAHRLFSSSVPSLRSTLPRLSFRLARLLAHSSLRSHSISSDLEFTTTTDISPHDNPRMFANLAASLIAITLATGAIAVPVDTSRVAARGYGSSSVSFENWGGISSLHGFDNFYGSDDFAHFKHFSPVVVRQSTPELVCHSQKVEIVQQRLAVLQEMAKRIITEQFCEVETQTIVFQQYYASLGGFSHDLRRSSGRHVGYDGYISSHFGSIYNSDGTLSNYDFNFTGSDIGASYYVPTNNWNEETSYGTVGSAYQASQAASFYYY